MKRLDRRAFLHRSLVWTHAAGLAACAAPRRGRGEGTKPTASSNAVRLGGPLFQPPEDPDELALAHRRLRYRAAYCPSVSLPQPDRVRAIRDAFVRHGVVLAEVGRWVNLMDADPVRRAAHLKQVTEGLALAEEYDQARLHLLALGEQLGLDLG
ncbi:MAG: hypothetical protein FJ387_25565 [Verrucomicrobia bacterium]|nr:hypothetical protein [Verrucomicrobiota bacterium]